MRPATRARSEYELADALGFVRRRLWDRDLDLGAVATHLHCSTRHVQRLFARRDTTFRQALLAMRLARAVELLSYGQRVGTVASAVGYRPRHFATAFQRAFGVPPSEARQAALLQSRLHRRLRSGLPRPVHPHYRRRLRAWRRDYRELRRLVDRMHPSTSLHRLVAPAIEECRPPRAEQTSMSSRAAPRVT